MRGREGPTARRWRGRPAGMTVAALVDAYLADPERAALRSKAEIERRLRRNVVPVIGAGEAVRTASAGRAERHGRDTAPRREGRGHPHLRRRAGNGALGGENEYLDANPLDGMDKPAAATSSDRVLSDEEIRTLWNGLPQALARSVQCQRIIKLCLVTAQRVGEVAGMVSAEIDLKAREWRLPGSRTKNGHAHVVPLSDLAISDIKDAAKDAGEGAPLFPCGGGLIVAGCGCTHHPAGKRDERRTAPWPVRHCAMVGARSAPHGTDRNGPAWCPANRAGAYRQPSDARRGRA